MADIIKKVVREPGAETPQAYIHRTYELAAIYFCLFFASIGGMALIVWRARLLVALAQRSNVETLVLAFFLVFFGYVAMISRPGAIGALRILFYLIVGLFRDAETVEARKTRALGPPRVEHLDVALNVVIERDDRPGEAFDIDIGDSAGSLGVLRFDGARLTFYPAHSYGSNNLFAYVENQLNKIFKDRGFSREVDIIHWNSLDDESTESLLSLVDFARNLERHLGAGELWPKAVLTPEDVEQLKRGLAEICRALRNECFLPDWEYSAEHKLPIVPEPLGLVSLGRTEGRADPLATMGFALFVVVASIGILGLLIAFPPWVPGK